MSGFSVDHLMKVCIIASLDKKSSPKRVRYCRYPRRVVSERMKRASPGSGLLYRSLWNGGASGCMYRSPCRRRPVLKSNAGVNCHGDALRRDTTSARAGGTSEAEEAVVS